MKVEASGQFLADIKGLKDKKLKQRVLDKIELLEQISSLTELQNLKKMKGFKNAFRLRIGEYRLGFIFQDNTIVLGRFLSRQEIYTFFP